MRLRLVDLNEEDCSIKTRPSCVVCLNIMTVNSFSPVEERLYALQALRPTRPWQ